MWMKAMVKSISIPVKFNADLLSAISAIIVAINMITVHCRALKYKKRIILVTNAQGSVDPSDNSSIAQQLLKEGIQLAVL
jgi:ATP-dependent DNA helicase 2 subunit 2